VFDVAARVIEVAGRIGKRPAQVALAWLLAKPAVTAPVVGASRPEQLAELAEAVSITLSEEDIAYLEALYRPVDNLLSLGAS
jgi:aryl-alcohol dehydrogenase-like predicted oxidoreductase